MTSFIRASRNHDRACIGLEMSDVLIRFVELSPRADGSLIPERFGTVGIAYDVVKDGEIMARLSLVESLKRLRAKTKALELRFPSFDNDNLNAAWSEVFAVAGFPHAHPIAEREALAAYTWGSQVKSQTEILGYFANPTTLEIHTRDNNGMAHTTFTYPLDAASAQQIQTLVHQSLLSRLPFTGYLPQSSRMIVQELDRQGIDAFAVDVWKRCFRYQDYVPNLAYEDAFKFSQALALAFVGAVIHDDHARLPSIIVQKKPMMPLNRELSVQEKFKNLVPVSTPNTPREELPTLESPVASGPTPTEVSVSNTKTNEVSPTPEPDKTPSWHTRFNTRISSWLHLNKKDTQ